MNNHNQENDQKNNILISTSSRSFVNFNCIFMQEGSDISDFLKFPDYSIDRIVCSNILEKLNQSDGVRLLKICRRILKHKGSLFLITCDLDAIIDNYQNTGFKGEYEWVRSNSELFNILIRDNNNRWIYNFSEISYLANFTGYDSCKLLNTKSLELSETDSLHLSSIDQLVCLTTHDLEISRPLNPLVSILIPAYNPDYFSDCLLSALSQSYDNTEIIVCDDSSENHIATVIDTFSSDNKITYFHNSKNIGQKFNYLKCLDKAKGDYIKFLNDDDILEKECVEKLLGCFFEDPTITVATSVRNVIDNNNEIRPPILATTAITEESCIIEGCSAVNLLLRSGINYIGEPSTVLFKKADINNIEPNCFEFGGISECYATGDVALYLNLLSKGNLAYLTEPLSNFRIHQDQSQNDETIHKQGRQTWQLLRSRSSMLGFLAERDEKELHYKSLGKPCSDWSTTSYSTQLQPIKKAQTSLTPRQQPKSLKDDYRKWSNRTAYSNEDYLFFSNIIASQQQHLSFHFVIQVSGGFENLIADSIDALSNQIYPYWHLTVIADAPCPSPVFEEFEQLSWIEVDRENHIDAFTEYLKDVQSDWIILLNPGDIPHKSFLYFLYIYSLNNSNWAFIYTDETILNVDGGFSSTLCKPDFNLDFLRSTDWLGSACAFKPELISEILKKEGFTLSFNYSMAFKTYDEKGESCIGHIPAILFSSYINESSEYLKLKQEHDIFTITNHLERNNYRYSIDNGLAESTYFIQYELSGSPLVTIIIPSKDNYHLLKRCISSIYQKTDYKQFEIIIVDNNSTDSNTLCYLETIVVSQLNLRVLHYNEPFNYSAMNNLAAQQAKGEYLLLLNDDTEIIMNEWLNRLLQYAQHDGVGAVGARLIYQDKTIQHAGVILGLDDLAHHPGNKEEMSEPGYMNRYQVPQTFCAVTGACLLVNKSKFDEVAGLNENELKVLYNDVDLCLKLKNAGYRNVWTPFSTLIHHGSKSLLKKKSEEEQKHALERKKQEAAVMLGRWGDLICNDPYYNKNLSLRHLDYRLDAEFAVPWDPNIIDRPKYLAFPNNAPGSRHYRVTAPLYKMNKNGMSWSSILPNLTIPGTTLPSPITLKRIAPDSFLIHSCFPKNSDIFRQYKSITKTNIIFGLDDLITEVPQYNPTSNFLPEEININLLLKNILNYCDRLIVSTEPIYDFFSKQNYISDIKIVPNCIDEALWSDLSLLERKGEKIRVGWAGALQHHGDLSIITEVVRDTATEIDWVFMGMIIPELKDYVKEFYPNITFGKYPEKLNSLNLDLAIAPLEINRFNEAKSNLRLLEYGILGIPVIATNIFPYRNSPAFLVENSKRSWISAIKELVSDRESLVSEGIKMKQWVHDNYLLKNNLQLWADALS